MVGSVCLDTSVSEYWPRYCHLSWGVDSYYLLLLCERRINGAWSTANQLLLWCVRFCSFIIHFMCGYGLTITATDFDTDGFVALLGRRCVIFSDLFCRSDQNVWSLKNWKLCCGIIAVNHISSIILKSTGRNIFRLPVAKYTRFSPNWQFCSSLNQWLCPSATLTWVILLRDMEHVPYETFIYYQWAREWSGYLFSMNCRERALLEISLRSPVWSSNCPQTCR